MGSDRRWLPTVRQRWFAQNGASEIRIAGDGEESNEDGEESDSGGDASEIRIAGEDLYMGIGEKGMQAFYFFVESMRNPQEDPIIFHFPGGPGASSLVTFIYETGPLLINTDDLTLTLNPNAWTQMANMVFIDMPAGTGFSYAETQEGWVSSDTIQVANYKDFIKKFLCDNPKFLENPLYISGISYSGIIVPQVTLELYEGNERGDQPAVNIQGYILCSPLTNKFMDFNSRIEYAHRMALISDDIYESAINNCNGNYVDTIQANSVCSKSLQSYEECTSRINFDNILEPVLDDDEYDIGTLALNEWGNMEAVQQALNVHQGMVGKFEEINSTLHYNQGKNDTICYAYDIFSSYSYHKKLSTKSCRALIFSGDHDLTFPYVGVEQWIASLNLEVEAPWKPFYVDNQVGGEQVM
ncbi:hypothetical protein E3N88_00841 [Mikania micrantha]|uniref:Uncharacterized protein n=1 Tax=Mikania micrantha TaxID=192012 RepID=A0A5N6PZB1_9ASTR|nr:hypothetical protein E3N88_00841 [Mikania micrantha]